MKKIFLIISLIMIFVINGYSQNQYVSWNFNTYVSNANYSSNSQNKQDSVKTIYNNNITISTITRGNGVSKIDGNTLYRTSGWPKSIDTVSHNGHYIYFTITTKNGITVNDLHYITNSFIYSSNITSIFTRVIKTSTTTVVIYIYLATNSPNNETQLNTISVNGDAPLPIKLQSFNSSVSMNNVNLTWKTESEINNNKFEIYRNDIKVGEVKGNGTVNTVSTYIFEDRNLQSGQYLYKLKQIDYNGNYEWFNLSSVVNITTPTKSNIVQNYPNPFNPTTKINYTVDKNSLVSIKVYDISGKQIVTLVDEYKTSGYYSVDFNGSNLSSGNYIYVYETNGIQITKRMTLIK